MRNTTHKLIAGVLLAAIVVTGCAAPAGPAPIRDETHVSRAYLGAMNIPSHGVALEGFCPVAYFAVHKAVRGVPEHASTWQGVTYYFVNADAKAAFDKEPSGYVPAYGGWCAYGMANGDKFPVDPTNFQIVDGRLMLFLKNEHVDARELWHRQDAREQAQRADVHWRKVQG